MLKTLCRCALLVTISSTVVYADDGIKDDIQVKPFTAEYTIIRKSDPIGTGVRKLEYLDNGMARYSYHSNIEWFIFSDERKESSVIKIDKSHITPTHYSYQRQGTGRDKKFEWQYDINQNTLTNLEKNKTKTIEFPVNIQDPLSYHLQQRLNLLQNPEQKHFVYPVVKTSGSIKNYVYQYDGEEEIMLPYGLVKTIRLKREVVEKKRITYAWFAPELDYLLVKLYQVKAGVEQLEAQLKSVDMAD